MINFNKNPEKFSCMILDDIDKKIVKYLQEDAKQTTKELSNKVAMSVTAIYERIKRLEREGIIKKYVALIDKTKVEKPLMVFCQIKLVQHTKAYVTQFEAEVTQLDEVSECFHTTGDYDYILKVYVENMEAYREFMVNKLTTIKHIGSSHSIFMIGEVKNSTAIAV